MSDRESKILIDVTYIPRSTFKAGSKEELLNSHSKRVYEPISTRRVLNGAARRSCAAHIPCRPASTTGRRLMLLAHQNESSTTELYAFTMRTRSRTRGQLVVGLGGYDRQS